MLLVDEDLLRLFNVDCPELASAGIMFPSEL
jgi:hypothetical protein